MSRFSLRFWLKSARASTSKAKAHRPVPGANRFGFRPRLEVLEDRTLPSGSPIMVTNLNDSGDGSLRAAITTANANPGSTIDFAHGLHGTITLSSGELDITSNVTIKGPGAKRITISGDDASRVFDIGNDATATISGLTIADGATVSTGENSATVDVTKIGGGGILNEAGSTLNLTDSVLANNTATASSDQVDVFGGGLLNEGSATVTSSLFRGHRRPGRQRCQWRQRLRGRYCRLRQLQRDRHGQHGGAQLRRCRQKGTRRLHRHRRGRRRLRVQRRHVHVGPCDHDLEESRHNA
jgi:hypothetical protein